MRYLEVHMQMLVLDFMQVYLTLFISFFNLLLDLAPLYLVPGGEWPFSLLGNSLLFRSELVPIHEWRIYFPWPSHWSISLKTGQGLAQALHSTALAPLRVEAQYVSLASSYNIHSSLDMIIHAYAICIYPYTSYHT